MKTPDSRLFSTLAAVAATALTFGSVTHVAAASTPGHVTTSSRATRTADVAPAGDPDWPFALGDWPTYNRDLQNDRFSPLTGISRSNVSNLHAVCTATIDGSGATDAGFETGPVVVNGVLYATTIGTTYAFDAATCQKKWSQAVPPSELQPGGLTNRGVAYAHGNVFRGTLNNHVVALAANDGSIVWDVDLAQAGVHFPAFITAAPITWRNVVYIGIAGADVGGPGAVLALDQANGQVLWKTATVPSDPASGTLPASSGWGGASHVAGGSTWTSYTLDSRRGLLLISTGNPAPDFFDASRIGDNPSVDSFLVMNAVSGKILEQYQWVKDDTHDWDIAATAAYVPATGSAFVAGKDGVLRKVQIGRPGSLWNTAVTTVDAHPAVPAPGTSVHFCPGSAGGTEWNGPTYSPLQDVVFVNTVDQCNTVTLEAGLDVADVNNGPTSANFNPAEPYFYIPGAPWTGAIDFNTNTAQSPNAPFGVADASRTGHVVAVDAENGRQLWRFDTPEAMVAGITSTASGLVFTADLKGDFYAFDARNGRVLKGLSLGQPVGGGVITYVAGSRQYVAVAEGMTSPQVWHTTGVSQIAVFGI